MSLTDRERLATSRELAANLLLSGLSQQDVQAQLGLTADRLQAALDVSAADPADVWLVRDYLERVVTARGATPVLYSSLTPDMRGAASRWFSLRDVDDVVSENSPRPTG